MNTATINIEKVVRVGTVGVHHRAASIFVKITFKDGNLSISGVVGPRANGNAIGSSGQIDMRFAHRDPEDNDKRYFDPIPPSLITFATGWNVDLWLDLLDIWKKWHLNDTKATCEHQRELGWVPQ